MFVTFDNYKALGYTTITDETSFPRHEDTAESIIDRLILDKPYINAEDTPSQYNNNNPTKWHTRNQRAVCEVSDLQYTMTMQSVQTNDNGNQVSGKISSYSNGDYSESYANDGNVLTDEAIKTKINEIVNAYFTQAQLYRGIC